MKKTKMLDRFVLNNSTHVSSPIKLMALNAACANLVFLSQQRSDTLSLGQLIPDVPATETSIHPFVFLLPQLPQALLRFSLSFHPLLPTPCKAVVHSYPLDAWPRISCPTQSLSHGMITTMPPSMASSSFLPSPTPPEPSPLVHRFLSLLMIGSHGKYSPARHSTPLGTRTYQSLTVSGFSWFLWFSNIPTRRPNTSQFQMISSQH